MNEDLKVEIERYLDGGMTPEEAAGFLSGLRQEPEALAYLGQALEQQALLYDGLRGQTEEGIRGAAPRARMRRLRGWRPEPGGSGVAWFVSLAAACVLMVVGLSLALRKPTPPQPRPTAQSGPEIPAVGTSEAERPVETVPKSEDRVRDNPPPEIVPTPPPPSTPPPGPPGPGPERLPEGPPPFVTPLPAERGKGTSAVAIARIERVEGDVSTDDGTKVNANHVVLDGQGLRTEGRGCVAVIRFPDGTRLEAAGLTVLRGIRSEGGRRVTVEEGILSAEVVRQAPGTSMVFATPHGEATVLGTILKIVVEADKTRVEVAEGRVRLRRMDGKAVEVAGGQYAVAAAGTNLVARPLPLDEILILPHQGVVQGAEWRLVRDTNAISGLALENLRTSNRFPDGVNADASRAAFAFKADADRAYTVWVRGRTLATKDPMPHDAVFLEWPEGQVVETPGASKGKGGHPSRALFNGFMHRAGYWWVGGDADGEADASAPVTVRFARPGWQVVRIYGYEPPVRIDALWLSTSQKSRPPDAQAGPR